MKRATYKSDSTLAQVVKEAGAAVHTFLNWNGNTLNVEKAKSSLATLIEGMSVFSAGKSVSLDSKPKTESVVLPLSSTAFRSHQETSRQSGQVVAAEHC